MSDVLAVIGSWGPCPVSESAPPCVGDLDRNGRVDIDDLLLVLASWPQ